MPKRSHEQQFLQAFQDGDISSARDILTKSDALSGMDTSFSAHPLLVSCVQQNQGHCYSRPHLKIAEFLLHPAVLQFRDAIIESDTDTVQKLLRQHPPLIHADLAAGRGIAQGIHHWLAPAIGETLIHAGADLDALTTRDDSPVSMQMRFGTLENLRLLLSHGANPNIGSGGHMPTRLMQPMIELLLEHQWDINRGQLLHDAKHGFADRVITWLNYGADPNTKNAESQSALHLLAKRGTGRAAIRALIQAGADPDALDSNGQSPMQIAAAAKTKAAESEFRRILGSA